MFLMISFYSCAKKKLSIFINQRNIKLLTKNLNSGEAIWAVACFRCHMYGTNGAVLLQEKEYWDAAASKGIDKLFESVWEGKEGEYGIMPAKGFCNLCSEEEIKIQFSIFSIWQRKFKQQIKVK